MSTRSCCATIRSVRQRTSSESGQVAVEAALIMPTMVFLVLGLVQLGMMHQARLMTEYAAYRAARSGVVNSGDCARMEWAGIYAVLPTLGPATGPLGPRPGRVDTLARALDLYNTYTLAPSGARNPNLDHVTGAGLLPRIRIEVLNPARSQLDGLFARYGAHLAGQELDYDDVRDEQITDANLLSVRVTYHYEMVIPFANWLIHSWYIGLNHLSALRGLQFESKTVGGASGYDYLMARGIDERAVGPRAADFRKIGAAALANVYLIPLQASYTMRMQSNLMKDKVAPCAIN